MNKNFLFLHTTWFEPMLFRALLRFSAGVLAATPTGGESSSYLKRSPHRWKAQARGSRLAALGGHFVLHFRFKNELASVGKRKFLFIPYS
jgi:hypothetical protein